MDLASLARAASVHGASQLRLRYEATLGCGVAGLWASAFTPDDQVLALIDDVAPGVTRSLLTNNDALLRDTLPLVHTRIAIPLFSARYRRVLGHVAPAA